MAGEAIAVPASAIQGHSQKLSHIALIIPAVVTMAVLPLHAAIAISLPNTLHLDIFILCEKSRINYLVTSKSLFRAMEQALFTLTVMALAVGTLYNTTRS